jgi:tryptophan synthase alpha subunit
MGKMTNAVLQKRTEFIVGLIKENPKITQVMVEDKLKEQVGIGPNTMSDAFLRKCRKIAKAMNEAAEGKLSTETSVMMGQLATPRRKAHRKMGKANGKPINVNQLRRSVKDEMKMGTTSVIIPNTFREAAKSLHTMAQELGFEQVVIAQSVDGPKLRLRKTVEEDCPL